MFTNLLRIRAIIRLVPLIAGAPLLLLAAQSAFAYQTYSDGSKPDGLGNCASCHELMINGQVQGFKGRAGLHDAHTSNATGTCLLCHVQQGDVPQLNTSGAAGGLGCMGCHGQPKLGGGYSGAGLRRHHAQAGASPDQEGFVCADCHSDPTPRPEIVMPAYYFRTDVVQKNPCTTLQEDFWNRTTGLPDGKGLDNDGDLVTESLDADCALTPCTDADADGFGNPGSAVCGFGSGTDCNDANNAIYPTAVEKFDSLDNNCNTEVDEIEGLIFASQSTPARVSWIAQLPSMQTYDVIRSDSATFPTTSANSICVANNTANTFADDPVTPVLGSRFYYLVRNMMVNDYGKQTGGTLRVYTAVPFCP
jgi:putative metal-binding protein